MVALRLMGSSIALSRDQYLVRSTTFRRMTPSFDSVESTAGVHSD